MRQKSDLRGYQNRIVDHLYAHDEALCVVRPGGGKTAAALTAIEELLWGNHIAHALVIAPKRVARAVWPDEIAQWAHIAKLRYQVLTGSPEQRQKQLADAGNYDVTIVGIDVVQWLVEELTKLPTDSPLFDLLVIDEISKFKDPKGRRANVLAKFAGRWKMVWGLSGTLRPNSAQDLFMPVRLVTRGKLWGRSFYSWRKEYFYPTDFQGYDWRELPGANDKLNEAIAPLTVTLTEDELPQLPELSIIFDRVELPRDAREIYHNMEEKLLARVYPVNILAANSAVATGKLAQIANGFLYEETGKLKAIGIHDEKRQWLRDLKDDAVGPMLLIYEFKEDLDAMRDIFGEDLPCLGAGAATQDDLHIKRWNAGELPFLALHPASGGHGLNLQDGGADMAWIAPTWSPELWEQTIARLYRSGQTKPVIVRVCTAADTVDQLKLNRVHFKMSAQQAFEEYLRKFHAEPAL
jgi:hypothetical protein